MNRQRVDVVLFGLDDLLEDPVLGTDDHRSLGSTVEFDGRELVVVDLLEGTKVHVGGTESMHLARLEDDSRSRSAGRSRGFSEERIELVDGEEVTQPVDSELKGGEGGQIRSSERGKERERVEKLLTCRSIPSLSRPYWLELIPALRMSCSRK